ncbi:MAG: SRPBCC family protein [Sphingobacteriales bacterium]|nr:MAG: SRPBCC family protein [Sphingobacteriales bacterium]
MGNTGRIASAAAGAAIAAIALTSRRGGNWRYGLLALGGGLIARGAVGYCPIQDALGIDTSGIGKGLVVNTSVKVRRPVEDVYNFWRNLENLPQFMTHLEDVREFSETQSQWVAKIPANVGKLYWDAEIVDEEQNQLIVWQSLEGADVDNAGEVHFVELPDGEGTEVHVRISYDPPAGALGDAVAHLFNGISEQVIKKNMRDFKALMEEGLEAEENDSNDENSSNGFSLKNIIDRVTSLV